MEGFEDGIGQCDIESRSYDMAIAFCNAFTSLHAISCLRHIRDSRDGVHGRGWKEERICLQMTYKKTL